MLSPPSLAVLFSDPNLESEARSLAGRLKIPIFHQENFDIGKFHFILTLNPEVLVLSVNEGMGAKASGTGLSKSLRLSLSFDRGGLNYRRRFGQLGGDLILAAMGSGGHSADQTKRVLDLTLGLGRDAFILASHGWQVTGIERNQVLYEMLLYAKSHAQSAGDLTMVKFMSRLDFIHADSFNFIKNLISQSPEQKFDAVYMDPMFLPKKKSALPKKEMQVLQKLVGTPHDEGESRNLAELVIAAGLTHRLFIKRPQGAQSLIQSPLPSVMFKSTSTRFDVYSI